MVKQLHPVPLLTLLSHPQAVFLLIIVPAAAVAIMSSARHEARMCSLRGRIT